MYYYFLSKYGNEEFVIKTAEEKGWSWTILQPATFLSNFTPPFTDMMYPQLATAHKVITPFPPELKLSYLDPDDIGRFAAVAFTSPDAKSGEFKSRRVPLASLHLTLQDVFDSMNSSLKKWGKDVQVKVEYLSKEEVEAQKAANPLLASQVFQAENPALVDLERVKGFGIELGGMSEFWDKQKEGVEKAVGL